MILIIAIYFIFMLLLLLGYLKFISSRRLNSTTTKISIIIPAKNEASILKDSINSLKRLDYPEQNFEVIIVDDQSSDNTYKLASRMIGTKNHFRIIRANNKTLPGKRGALLRGIEESKYPFIMMTDADCLPCPGWLNAASALFEQGYEFILGPAPLIRQQNNFISSVSCMDNLKNHFLSFSLASLGLPYTAAARNMGISKEAFFKIGGYTNTQDTVSGDDDLLLREAVKNNLKIKAFDDKNAMVFSDTPLSPSEYLRQKARHTQSSLHYLFKHKIILGSWHLLNLFMIFSPILIFLDFNFIWPAAVKLSSDIIVLSLIRKRYGYGFNPIELIYLDITYEIFLVINFLNSLSGKVEWK